MDLFSRFFRENQEKFLAFAYSYIRSWAEAEDILMESMISLWECRDRWEEDKGLHALLLTIIKNKALNYLEHEQTRLRIEEDLNSHRQRELDLRIATLKNCEPDKIFSTEIQHIVNKALDKMPPQSREIFMLSRYSNLPNKKIAEQLNLFSQNSRIPYHQSPTYSACGTERLSRLYPTLVKLSCFSLII